MAQVEEPRLTTLAERIAALNQQRNFQAPPSTTGKRAPPPPPVRAATFQISPDTSDAVVNKPALPARPTRAITENGPPLLPRRTATDLVNGGKPGPLPLPSRNSQQSTPPALPSRSPSVQSHLTISTPGARRNSSSSDLSVISSLSLGRTKSSDVDQVRKLPPPLEQANLPPLPPTRRELEAKAKESAQQERAKITPPLPTRRITEPPSLPTRRITEPPAASLATRPSLPPRLPSRPAKLPAVSASEDPSPALPARRLPPPVSSLQTRNALGCGFNSKPKANTASEPSPPPIPLSSRPSVSQIDALVSRPVPVPQQQASQTGKVCLICRDFSGPDHVASQYPLESLPRSDPVGYLATNLCGPFSSDTDKARAIFAWCHHNIAYDTYAFFNKCIKHQSVEEQIFSGLAVCEGYARIFEAIAKRAGLQCALVSGHGKGFGYETGMSASAITDTKNHAWNVVRIDDGEWKLVDACWGAGFLCTATGDNLYKKKFNPSFFTMSNEAFGERHFPTDPRHLYRKDGRALTFEDYVVGSGEAGEKAMFSGHAHEEGLDENNFLPSRKNISVYKGPDVVRFQFAKICEHWKPEVHGKGKQMLFCLQIGGLDGRKEDIIPLETDGKFWWWLDVKARDLGAPGQSIALIAFTDFDGKDGRGLTKAEFLRRKGRCGYSYCFLIKWELVA